MERVLVIDDSELVVNVLGDALTGAGFGVHTALDGEQGLQAERSHHPHVVLCDMNMPGLSGLDVVERLRRQAPLTPVLIFTEAQDLRLAVEAMQRGAYGYLTKSADTGGLIHEVKKAVAHRHVLERNQQLEVANLEYQHNLERMVQEKTAELARLEAARAQAEKLAAIGSLVAGVAHEINNPLAVMVSNTNFLLEEAPPALAGVDAELASTVRRAIEDMLVCSTRIQRIVTGLRRLSYQGRAAATCRVKAVVDEVRVLCRGRVTVPVEWQLDPAATQLALSQDDAVSAVSNLIVNGAHAVEAAKRDGKVRVSVARRGGDVLVEVEDTGCGIPQEHLGRVLDPFFTTKPPGKGTGLGLSLVRQVVHNAGGELSIDSVVGKGTTVRLRVPVEPPPEVYPPTVARA